MPTSARVPYVWSGSEWIPIGPQVGAISTRWIYTANGGETTLSGTDDNGLSLSYTPGFEQVYLNGVLLIKDDDYTATTGTSITGLTALSVNDIIQILTLDVTSVDNTYTQDQADSLFLTQNSASTTYATQTSLTDGLASKLDATAPVGKILQVVTTNKTDTSAISTASYTFTSDVMTVTITPTATNSKIFINGQMHGATSAQVPAMQFRLLRGGTAIGVGDAASNRALLTSSHYAAITNAANMASVSFSYIDSPNTTSATTYSIQLYNSSSITRTLYVNRTEGDTDNASHFRTISTITVMEVAA